MTIYTVGNLLKNCPKHQITRDNRPIPSMILLARQRVKYPKAYLEIENLLSTHSSRACPEVVYWVAHKYQETFAK